MAKGQQNNDKMVKKPKKDTSPPKSVSPDAALVMHEGRLAGELARGDISEEAVMHLATGSERSAA